MRKKSYPKLRFLVDSYHSTIKLRMMSDSRVTNLKRDWKVKEKVCSYYKQNIGAQFQDVEKWLKKEIKGELADYEIWNDWLKGISGIDVCSAGGLLAWIGDIARFASISKLYSYSGLATIKRCQECKKRYFEFPGDKAHYIERYLNFQKRAHKARKEKGGRFNKKPHLKAVEKLICSCDSPEPKTIAEKKKRGEPAMWNQKLKSHCWKIGKNFVRSGKQYRKYYDKVKAKYQKKFPKFSKGHIDNMAMRKTVKLFMAHLWIVWRQLEGLPTRSPYPVEKLGHKYIPPFNK